MSTVSIVNYGLGNVQAIANIYKKLNLPARIVSTAEELKSAERLILPGVGAFDWAMKRLGDSGMRETLDELVLGARKPVLGICVGMQMMAKSSDEGILPGLGWIDARVKRFDSAASPAMLLPQMGWNDVEPVDRADLFRGFEPGARFYFLHSYFFETGAPEQTLATTDYFGRYASSVRSGNVFGAQFHPEKSHHWGIKLLQNFAEAPLC